jgi:hypothetical protein
LLLPLFSSIGQDRVDTENNIFQCEVEDFDSKIDQNLITSDSPISLNIYQENIKSVLESLRSGKACGINEIPNECLKYGGNTQLNSLLDLFMKITYLDLHKGIIKPIHKGGSMYNVDNNRGITLTSNVYKVYAKIIEQSVMNFMEDIAILGEVRGAFRRDKGYVHLVNQKRVRHSSLFKTFLKLLTEFGGMVYLTYCGKMVFRVNVGNIYDIFIVTSVLNTVLFGDFESDWLDQEFRPNRDVSCPQPFSLF